MKTSLTFEFASLAEAAEYAPILLAAKLPERPADVAPLVSAVELSAPKAPPVKKTSVKIVGAEVEEPVDEPAPSTAPADFEVEAEHDGSEYLKVVSQALPVIGQDGLRKAMLAAGHVTDAGTAAPVKDPMPAPSVQYKIIAEVEKLVAARTAKTAKAPAAEAPTEEPLTKESYLEKIMTAHAVVGDKGWMKTVKDVKLLNSSGKPISPKFAPPEKWAEILEHLDALVAAAETV